jgi:hypothetical protein
LALKNLFNTMKQTGLTKRIDQYMLTKEDREDTTDRKNETNSPSSSGGCSRANYYQRSGMKKETVEPRVQRIFENGHDMHERYQKLLLEMGDLLMDEVPLHNEEYEIQGHTDGILCMSGKPKLEVEILELKSINGRGFTALKDSPKVEHIQQSHTYMFTAEELRKHLRETYPTLADFKKSKLKRIKKYRKLYQHLQDGKRYTRAEKIQFKVNQHLKMDEILYNVKRPIRKAIIFYENKDTQETKDFVVEYDKTIMDFVLGKFEVNNEAWRKKKIPPRECKNKNDGRWCNFVSECFKA